MRAFVHHYLHRNSYKQSYYIKNGTTIGPVNGEQYFVEDSVKEKLKLKLVPSEWVCRFKETYTMDWLYNINKKYPGDYMYMGDFNPDNSTFMPTQPGPFAFIGPPGACMLGDGGGFGVAANCKWGAEITHGPNGTTVSGKLTCNA